jgi:hypothetical protein
MTGREIYGVWAPASDEWSPWVKPVLFAEIDDATAESIPDRPLEESSLRCDVGARCDTAILVDLPGTQSLLAGFALARDGYRPVPLYNTTSGRRQRVPPEKCVLSDVSALVQMLSRPLPDYVRNTIIGDHPPAFLLDSHRLKGDRGPAPGMYDNRWLVFPQDFPSARFLSARGITRAIVIQETILPAEDLTHVLLRWTEGGIAIHVQDASEERSVRPADLRRPPRFRRAVYCALALMGLRRNSAGGFGSVIPVPGQGGGFG